MKVPGGDHVMRMPPPEILVTWITGIRKRWRAADSIITTNYKQAYNYRRITTDEYRIKEIFHKYLPFLESRSNESLARFGVQTFEGGLTVWGSST
jgi:hypothetical protein